MFRHLILFPSTVDPGAVQRIVADDLSSAYSGSQGFQSLTVSVGPLMGPAAREGEIGSIVEATFDTLDTAVAAVKAESFQATKTKVESLGVRIYLFEFRDA